MYIIHIPGASCSLRNGWAISISVLASDAHLVIWLFKQCLVLSPSWLQSYGSWIYNYCVIRAYHHLSCEFEARSFRGVLETTLCDKVCQWLATGRWYSPNTPVSSTNKTDRHNIADMLLNVVLNTITDSPSPQRMLLNNNAYFGYVELMSNISLTCV
jgi:hypothetical protein